MGRMRVHVEAVLEQNPQEFIGWALERETGWPVLVVISGAQRVRVAMPPEDARELGCGGIFAAMTVAAAAAAQNGNPAGVAGGLVDASGVPLRAGAL